MYDACCCHLNFVCIMYIFVSVRAGYYSDKYIVILYTENSMSSTIRHDIELKMGKPVLYYLTQHKCPMMDYSQRQH